MLGRALVAVAALVATGSGVAAAPSPQALLARHAPVVVLHPAERFQPVPVDGFLADSDVKRRQADGTWGSVGGPLPVSGGQWRLDQRLCSARDGIAAIGCYASAEAAHGARPTVYGAYHRRGSRIALQYWLFYPLNPYSTDVPPNPRFAQVHEGDWELVTVILDRAGHPLTAGYSRHCSGAKRSWAKVEKRGQRPVVYVALGSHANYFAPGTTLHERRCWPELAISVFEQNGRTLRDFAARGRTLSPRVVTVTASSPRWMRFPGTWGEDQFAFIADGVLPYGAGPSGPAFKKVWKSPIGVPLSWPTA
ncbi:MAG TPA: Vps62-related protein [Gaiellaceae bacterium]|nr:Vps62-related protein [Gaiellaceae bacterium]